MRALQNFKGLEKRRWGWKAICPAHNDLRKSLSIRVAESGDLLLKCHAGCTFDDICQALNMTAKDFNAAGHEPQRIAATYDYTDEMGYTVFQVVRFDPKDFRQRRKGPDGWLWDMDGVQRVPYRLHRIVKYKDSPVVIVEGEKSVDLLEKHGFLATCSPGGAGKWQDDYGRFFEARRVVIVPDNDLPGERHALQVRKKLLPVASRVVIARLCGIPEKGDVFDWLEKHGPDNLRTLLSQALSVTIDDTLERVHFLEREEKWRLVRMLLDFLNHEERPCT